MSDEVTLAAAISFPEPGIPDDDHVRGAEYELNLSLDYTLSKENGPYSGYESVSRKFYRISSRSDIPQSFIDRQKAVLNQDGSDSGLKRTPFQKCTCGSDWPKCRHALLLGLMVIKPKEASL